MICHHLQPDSSQVGDKTCVTTGNHLSVDGQQNLQIHIGNNHFIIFLKNNFTCHVSSRQILVTLLYGIHWDSHMLSSIKKTKKNKTTNPSVHGIFGPFFPSWITVDSVDRPFSQTKPDRNGICYHHSHSHPVKLTLQTLDSFTCKRKVRTGASAWRFICEERPKVW